MLSKQQVKFINSLKIKKYRREHSCFLAEGTKLVSELINSKVTIESIIVSQKWLSNHVQKLNHAKVLEIDDKLFSQISTQSNPDGIMAIAKIPVEEITIEELKNKWTIALDNLQDPGNLGTIIRIADWFGIETILCSRDTVDTYNPKTVQATMGSIARVKIIAVDLINLLGKSNIPIYATAMNGDNIFKVNTFNPGIILIGNEANGVSDPLLGLSDQQISIPRLGKAESLNAGIATGIIVAQLLNLN